MEQNISFNPEQRSSLLTFSWGSPVWLSGDSGECLLHSPSNVVIENNGEDFAPVSFFPQHLLCVPQYMIILAAPLQFPRSKAWRNPVCSPYGSLHCLTHRNKKWYINKKKDMVPQDPLQTFNKHLASNWSDQRPKSSDDGGTELLGLVSERNTCLWRWAGWHNLEPTAPWWWWWWSGSPCHAKIHLPKVPYSSWFSSWIKIATYNRSWDQNFHC